MIHFGLHPRCTMLVRGLLLVVIGLTSAVPGLTMTRRAEPSEAELPCEERDRPSLVAAVSRQRRVQLRAETPPFLRSRPCHPPLAVAPASARVSRSGGGHRLSNGLLAPLIC